MHEDLNRRDPEISGTLTEADARQLAALVRKHATACELDLNGMVVLTEAATSAYAATAAAAAFAGAEVHALCADTAYGSARDGREDVTRLVEILGIKGNSPQFAFDRSKLPVERTDIVTNSGLLRPIDHNIIGRLPQHAVVALMYEAWEAREGDIDLVAALDRGIEVVGVNEHHDKCRVFQVVGDLVIAAAERRQWTLTGQTVAVLSDNSFADPVIGALAAAGCDVAEIDLHDQRVPSVDYAVIAVTPASSARAAGVGAVPVDQLTSTVAASRAKRCIQLWGDLDRASLSALGVEFEPAAEPRPGHQGIEMSAAGFDPVVLLQVGGLAAVLHRDVPPESPFGGLAQPVGLSDPGRAS